MAIIEGIAPLTISFTNSSIGEGLLYSWNFGDGSISEDKNVKHIFNNSGTYSVSLTVKNENGSDTKSDTVVVSTADGSGGNGERNDERNGGNGERNDERNGGNGERNDERNGRSS